jgi:hypothetical protein
MYLQRNIEARSHYHCCRGIAITTTYSACFFVAFVTQYAKCMRPLILSSVAYVVVLYHIFPHYLISGTVFGKKDITHDINMCFDFLYNLVWNIFHFEKNSMIYYHK